MSLEILSTYYATSPQLEKLASFEDEDQTDSVTALPRPHALRSAAVIGLGRATRAPANVAVKRTITVNQYPILVLTLIPDLNL